MTNNTENGKTSNSKKKWYLILTPIAILFIVGTWSGTGDGFAPFWTVKNGSSLGINFGVVNSFYNNSFHSGINIGAGTVQRRGSTINGISIGAVNGPTEEDPGGVFNGVEIGLGNFGNDEIGNPLKREVNGLQVGLYNTSRGHCFQIGIYNSITKDNGEVRTNFGINWYFGE